MTCGVFKDIGHNIESNRLLEDVEVTGMYMHKITRSTNKLLGVKRWRKDWTLRVKKYSPQALICVLPLQSDKTEIRCLAKQVATLVGREDPC